MLGWLSYNHTVMQDVFSGFNFNILIYNDLVMFLEIIVAFSTLMLVGFTFYPKYLGQTMSHWIALELIWTLLPIMMVMFLGFPSLKMLYMNETFSFNSDLSLKIVGHQWYWEYNMPEFQACFTSYPKLVSEYIRLAESDFICVPFNCNIRVLVTSEDVLHAWSMPSLGVKMDACPGRMNFLLMASNKPGKMVGQCSELCGNYHSWMPIQLQYSSFMVFSEWLKMHMN